LGDAKKKRKKEKTCEVEVIKREGNIPHDKPSGGRIHRRERESN